MAHHSQVVRDEQVGQLEPVLQLLEQVYDLCLDRYVQGGNGLVGDDERRIDRKCPRDDDALLLPPAELVRVPVLKVGVQAHSLQELLYAVLYLIVLHDPVNPDRFGYRLPNGLSRVERRRGVLEDDLHLLAERAHFVLLQLRKVRALERDLSFRRLLQLQDRVAERRLPATALSHEAKRLALAYGEVDAVDRADDVPVRPQTEDDPLRPDLEVRLEALDV